MAGRGLVAVVLVAAVVVPGRAVAQHRQDEVAPTTTATPPTTIVVTTLPPTTTVPPTTAGPTTTVVSVPTTTIPDVPVPRAEGRLEDVAASVGLRQVGHSWDLAVGHLDAGPTEDLVIADHEHVRVWVNRRGRFERLAALDAGDPHGCAVADVDGNGLTDVYCSHGSMKGSGARPNRLFLQGPAGRFVDRATAYGVVDQFGRGRRVAFGDFDHVPGPDLFVGNQFGRSDERISRNRVFFGGEAPPMVESPPIAAARVGALCVQVADQDGDGWQDILLCGGDEQHTQPSVATGLHLLRNVPDGHGGRRFVERAAALGIALPRVEGARLAHLNGDRRLDLVTVTNRSVVVRPGLANGAFGAPVFSHVLTAGVSVAVGDVDGRNGNDIFVVQGCNETGNVSDLLLVHRVGYDYRPVTAPPVGRGCGDTAVTMAVDGRAGDEVVVGNGRWASHGPFQVLTYRRSE
jgi:hypothetical protein